MSEEPNIFKRYKISLFKSPMDELNQVAYEANLLGENSATGTDFPGYTNRISFAQAQEIRNTLSEKLLRTRYKKTEHNELFDKDNEVEFYKINNEDKQNLVTKFTEGLRKLGSYELQGAQLGKFTTTAQVIANGIYLREVNTFVHIVCDDQSLVDLADIANNLSYAVALLEGNLPPNDLGYIPDHALSLVRKDEIATDNVERVYKLIKASVGNHGMDILGYYNAIVDRIQFHRPLFMDKPVRKHKMPVFEEDKKQEKH